MRYLNTSLKYLMCRGSVFLFLLTILTVLFAKTAFAADYEVATDYWPPFREMSDDGEIEGYDVDLMQDIARRMKVGFSFVRYPWARCLENMAQGRSDLMTGLARTPEREKYILYTDQSYHQCRPAFYVRHDYGVPLKSYEDLQDLTIGYTRNSAYFEPFDSDDGLRKVAVANERTLLRMLLKGRLDVVVGTDCQVLTDIRQMGIEGLIEQAEYAPDASVKLYLGVSKKSPLAIQMGRLNTALEEAIADGTTEALRRKYFP